MGGGDPGKSCVFPFKFNGVVNTECTLQSASDGIPWCSTLTDESGTHVSGQGKWGHCAPECLLLTIVREPSVDELCGLKQRSTDRKMETCSKMSTNTTESFYITILATIRGFEHGRLTVSGPNLRGIKEPCMALPDEEDPSKLCIFPLVKNGVEYNHCLKSGKGQSHWCFTEISQNKTIKRGNCGPTCPLPDGEERCITDKNKPCIFPFKFNNMTFNSCTWAYSNTVWCSTQVDSLGIHVGGSKGTCGSGCRIPPRPDVMEQKELPIKEFHDVLKDIFLGDLGIKRSLVTSDGQFEYICGTPQSTGYDELRRSFVNSTTFSYREMCEDPAWNGLRGVNTTGITWGDPPIGSVFCRGHRPSQLIIGGHECDNEYDCMDRSDENGCEKSSQIEILYEYDSGTLESFKKIGRQPETNMSNFIDSEGGLRLQRKECNPPTVPYSEVFPSRCPSDNLKIPCNENVEQIRIGGACYPYHMLCTNMDDRSQTYSHPDHIAFCQNYTFWKTKVKKDEEGLSVRPWTDESGDKIYACRGNFPGFNSYRFKHSKPGCRRAYCPDLSDRVCPINSSTCDKPEYFHCKDNSSCIPATLVCDGYVNCKDESDEDKEYCSGCPLKRGDGHPRRLKSEKFANTFRCKQRYTGKIICANPCDGRDDLCEGYADERNCNNLAGGWTYFAVGITITIIFSLVFLSSCKKVMRGLNENMDQNIFHLAQIGKHSSNAKVKYDSTLPYGQRRIDESFGSCFMVSMWKEELNGYGALQKLCCDAYKAELKYNVGDQDATNIFFMETLGTNDAAQQFFDNIDNGVLFRKKKYLKRKKWVNLHKDYIMSVFKPLLCLISVILYYFDIFKDLLLSIRLYFFLGDVLPIIFFSFIVVSIILGEVANMISVINFSPWSAKRRLIACLVIPTVPGIITYFIFRIESEVEKQVKKGETQDKILETWSYLHDLKRLRSKMRTNENILEHLPQLVILLLLIFIKQYKHTTTVPLHLSSNLVPDNELLFVFSALTSFISLSRGQLSLIITKKNGYIPSLGKLVLLCFFIIGTAARVLGLLLYFTPSLGIFNTFYHYKLGLLLPNTYGKLHPVFEINSNGQDIYDWDLWRENYKISRAEDIFNIPYYLLICTLLLVVVVHLAISQLFKKLYFKGIKGTKINFPKNIIDDLSTLLSPPLHLDWELIYRQGGGTGISIRECWIRSKRLLLAYNILLFFEHVIMLVPMVVLKIALDERNALLEKDFPPIGDELLSTKITNCLICSGFAVFMILPVISYLLSYLYFIKWHAWSRVLRSQI